MPKEQPKPRMEKPQDVVNIVFTIAAAHVGCITPFIRCRFGSYAFGGYWLSAVIMFSYAALYNCGLLVWYMLPWGVMVAFRRLTADNDQHSRYQGYPWVFGRMTGEYVARIGEVFIVFFLGVFAAMVSVPLSNFVLLEMVSLVVVLWIESATLQARKRAMKDAEWQARQMADLNRGGNGW
jgi:hypothetical protein